MLESPFRRCGRGYGVPENLVLLYANVEGNHISNFRNGLKSNHLPVGPTGFANDSDANPVCDPMS